MQDTAVDRIVAHLARVAAGALPTAARAAAATFIADSFGVGIAGARAPWRPEVLDMAAATGGAGEARVWGSGERLPLAAAAMVNAYQMHALEFDCVHDGAVVHAMSVVLPSLVGWAERDGGVDGERLLRAAVAGVDVAVTLGLSSRAPMRFFRPANCSGFGAVAGLCILLGLGEEMARDALGIYYGQCGGTMQAHVEASPQLAMQMGFAARGAVTAVELARRGMPGPRAPLSGEFGYFALFHGAADTAPFDQLGRLWRIAELSHKPFPTGRATHGGIDGLQRLIAAHRLTAERVRGGRFVVSPLTHRLVGRPAKPRMPVAAARLCLCYTGAVCLRRGTVGIDDFTAAALNDPPTLELAARLAVGADANPDPQYAGAGVRRTRSRRRRHRRLHRQRHARQPGAPAVAGGGARQVCRVRRHDRVVGGGDGAGPTHRYPRAGALTCRETASSASCRRRFRRGLTCRITNRCRRR